MDLVIYAKHISDENSTKSSAMLTDLPSESLIPVGESVILECLSGDPQSTSAWHVVNEYGQPIRSMLRSIYYIWKV